MAALPLLKLSTLLVKTIAKPLASQLKSASATRPRLANFCASIGNSVHYIYSRANVIAAGHKFVGVKPLPAEQAVSDGISTLSEALVLGFSAGAVIIDALRSANSNALKAEKAAEEKRIAAEELEKRFLDLERKVEEARLERSSWLSLLNNNDQKVKTESNINNSWFQGWF